jgi:hypothetical protein
MLRTLLRLRRLLKLGFVYSPISPLDPEIETRSRSAGLP